jgi:hypothetical protein
VSQRVGRIVPVAALAAVVIASLGAASPRSVAIPIGRLPEPDRRHVEAITGAADVSTRVEAKAFPARADVFEYLLDHPELAAHVARTLHVARYRVWRTPEGLALDDGWGAHGHFRVVYAAQGTRVMLARGRYDKALLPPIHGQAVAMIEYRLEPAEGGRSLVRPTVSGYVKLDSRLLAGVLRVASAAAQRKADLEAHRLMKVFAKVSRELDEDPAGVLEQLRRNPDVPRGELEEFARLLEGR